MAPNKTSEQLAFEAAQTTQQECLRWPGSFGQSGYGRIRTKKHRNKPASRLVCEIAHGASPTPQHEAAHSCGNRWCVNPAHLRWATRRENLSDRVIHGTLPCGDRHGNTEISDAVVSELFNRFYALTAEWAAELGTNPQTIRRILRGVARTHGDHYAERRRSEQDADH